MWRCCLIVGFVVALASPLRAEAAIPPVVAQGLLCRSAVASAERVHGIPAQLLAAINRVESGRPDPATGAVHPWPWTIDVEGAGAFFNTKAEAIAAVRAAQARGIQSIDVGCAQINLMHHPDAFASFDEAFDPAANAKVAARFLTSLHTRLGNWEDAVAAYHSATPALGVPYRQAVYSNWSAPVVAPQPVSPVKIFSINGVEIRVWTPSAIGTAASIVAIPASNALPLPRVITGGR